MQNTENIKCYVPIEGDLYTLVVGIVIGGQITKWENTDKKFRLAKAGEVADVILNSTNNTVLKSLIEIK
jgi:hypothetical protein